MVLKMGDCVYHNSIAIPLLFCLLILFIFTIGRIDANEVEKENEDSGEKAVNVINSKADCPGECTGDAAIHRPVCGREIKGVHGHSKLRTFSNLCAFKMEQCTSEGWTLFKNRDCDYIK